MATTSLNRPGSTHDFYWSGPAPKVGTVLVTDRGVGYLVARVRPSRLLRAVILTVTCVRPTHPSLRDRAHDQWTWHGLRGHPKSLARVLRDLREVAHRTTRR